MNYQFITETQSPNRLLKYALMCFFICFCFLGWAQESKRDSITILKNWNDKNGVNELTINAGRLCNPEEPPFDGSTTKIEANLKNKLVDLNVFFEDENYQMEMILFYESDIEIIEVKNEKAVFIPFFYCGNFDNDIKVSYIIFYKNKGYLFHINFHCNEGNECKLNDDLQEKLMTINDKHLKKIFQKKLKSDYKIYSDFHITIN